MPRKKRSADSLLTEISQRVDAQYDLLTEEEKQLYIQEAKKHVEEQRKSAQKDAFLKRVIEEENARFDPNEELVEVEIRLGDYAPFICINDRMRYYHGVSYTVPHSLAVTLNDIMWQTQQHQREIDGKRRKGDILRDPFNRGVNTMSDVRMNDAGVVTGRRNLRI